MPRGKILIVDDEPRLARAVKDMIGPEYDIDIVTTGAEALRLLASALGKTLHVEKRKAAAHFDAQGVRAEKHSLRCFTLRYGIVQGVGKNGGERGSAATVIPFLNHHACVAYLQQ